MMDVKQWQPEWDRENGVWLLSDLRRVLVIRFRKLLHAENFATRDECPDYVEDVS